MPELVSQLRQCGQRAGLAAVGVAPASPMQATRRVLEDRKAAGLAAGMQFTYRNPSRSTDPSRIVPGARALVVGAWWYGGAVQEVAEGVPDGRPRGLVARYARTDHYADLRAALGSLARALGEQGWSARVVADDNALVDRAAAQLGGLGWFGKNCNILLPGRGSWFLLGSVVTDAPLPPDVPIAEGCGRCQRCLRSCPTGALVAPGVLDARKCLAWLLQAEGVFPWELRAALGVRVYGCDDCQESCPPNREAVELLGQRGRGESTAAGDRDRAGTGAVVVASGTDEGGIRLPVGGRPGQRHVDILGMLEASDAELLRSHGRWYIPRRDPRYLRRNALIVLGNTADGWSPPVGAALERYLHSEDEMLQAHAVWAAARLGRRDLVARTPGLLGGGKGLVAQELSRLDEVVPRAPAATLGAAHADGATAVLASEVPAQVAAGQ